MKIFNYKYFLQNIKKSKSIILLLILVSFIINIIFLNNVYDKSVYNIWSDKELYDATQFTMIIFPCILSIVLFGILFKKNGNDFINSMPITRKTLYLTNTIGGIVIIIVSLIINVAGIYIYVKSKQNIEISRIYIMKYFFVAAVICVCVYTITNFAMCMAGNAITTIMLSSLFLFVIPFFGTYYCNMVNSVTYYDSDKTVGFVSDDNEYVAEKNCKINENIYKTTIIYRIKDNSILYLPLTNSFFLIESSLKKIDYKVTIVVYVILSIICFIAGYFLYLKKKMENVETSFKNVHIHEIVKCMILLPFLGVLPKNEEVSFSEFIWFFIFILFFIAYFWIYDIFTRKKMVSITKNIIYFVCCLFVGYLLFYSLDKLDKENDEYKFSYNDIDNIMYYSSLLDRYIVINDDKFKEYVVKKMTDVNNIERLNHEKQNGYGYGSKSVKINTIDGECYNAMLCIQTQSEYNEFKNIFEKSVDYDEIIKECVDKTKNIMNVTLYFSTNKSYSLDSKQEKEVKNEILNIEDKFSLILPENSTQEDYGYYNLDIVEENTSKRLYVLTYEYDSSCHHMIVPIKSEGNIL